MKNAFTLVEIMVVMVVIVLLSAAAVPQMRGITADLRLRDTVEDVKLLLENGRRQAVDNGLAVIFTRDDQRWPCDISCMMNAERAVVFPDGRIVNEDTSNPVEIIITDGRGVSWLITTAGTCGAVTAIKLERL
jgi:prepilin-type N-terminal cleavage/methylation domain-containing protein